MKRLFLIIIACFLFSWIAGAAVEKGLVFYSYEVNPGLRTSLLLPENPSGGVIFSKTCRLAFDFKVDTSREQFGYVCRIVVDGVRSIDILLSTPYDGTPYIGVVTDSRNLEALDFGADAGLDAWHSVEVAMAASEDSLNVIVNGCRISLPGTDTRKHSVSVLFGANSYGRFATTDVAPFSLKNISFQTDKGKVREWSLASEDDMDKYASVRLAVSNPLWMLDLNRKWHRVSSFRFNSKVFLVPDRYRPRIFMVAEGNIVEYSLKEGTTKSYFFAQDIKTGLISNDFCVLPDGRLAFVDMDADRPFVNWFDFESSGWQRQNPRTNQSRYLHHNVFYNSCDSSVVSLFGYGFHTYYNELDVFDLENGGYRTEVRDEIEPRYLSSVGIADSVALIYGGKGNDVGMQELGQVIYDDLYVLNLNDYSVKELWSLYGNSREVAAPDLWISDDRKSFYALTWCPDTYETELVLKKISVADGSRSILGDPVAFKFIDVGSEVRLMYQEGLEAFFAIVSSPDKDGRYNVEIYRINLPVLDMVDMEEECVPVWIWILSAIAVLGVAAAVYSLAKKGQEACVPEDTSEDDGTPMEAEPSQQDETEEPDMLSPGIYLVGGFRVIDRNCTDISDRFTPLMKQLLSAIILYTDKSSGVSNAELKEMFWYDKSDESYSNNRGVNIKKIRNCLAEVGNLNVVNSHGRWSLSDEDGLCDYMQFLEQLDDISPARPDEATIEMLVSISSHGSLLPEMRLDWVDQFKAEYTDKVISMLSAVRENAGASLSPEMQIRIADSILVFDPLDENSICAKCKALVKMKRLGSAKKIYASFIAEYERVMGEKFSVDFQNFIKG